MLMKVSLSVNFINVICERFSYKFFNKAKTQLEKRCLYEKFVRKMLMKMSPCRRELFLRSK